MFNSLNKGISTPIAIAIVLLLAVSVWGIILWQYSAIQKEKVELPEIEVQEGAEEALVLEENDEEATGWKTYRDEEYGFEIEYPSEKDFWLDFKAGPELPLWSSNAQDYFYGENAENVLGRFPLGEEVVNNIRFKVNYFVTYEGMGLFIRGAHFFTEYKDNYYVITVSKEGTGVIPKTEEFWAGERILSQKGEELIVQKMANKEDEFMKTFSQVLSTFKFLEVDKEPSLETLKNMEYQIPGFSSGRFKLNNGVYDFSKYIGEDETGFIVELVDYNVVHADLNDDGIGDALVDLRIYEGGNSNTAYLAAVISKEGGSYYNINAVQIGGGRSSVEVLSIDSGIITVRCFGWYDSHGYLYKIKFSKETGLEILEEQEIPQPEPKG